MELEEGEAMRKEILGFTLIELMVTLVILAVLALIAAPLTQVAVQRSKEQDLKTALRQIREAIDAYKMASDEGRIQKSSDESGYPPTLRILEDGVEDIKDPKRQKIYFIRRLPSDPMSEEQGSPEASWGKRSYRSPVDRPEEGRDVFDIYSRSEAKGLNGIVYKEW